MKVILAKTAGFCMGVRRAMNAVIEATHRSRSTVYTLGPLVHNHQAIAMLRARNVRVVPDASEVEEGSLFIRAHGVTPEMLRACEKEGVTVCDMTCPHVRHAQNIISRRTRDGFDTIIVGDKNHAEVVGLLGRAGGRGHVIGTPAEAAALPDLDRVCVVAQTTQSSSRFEEIVAAVKARFPDAQIHNTICSATDDRQNEVRDLAKQVDAMVVVGGQHSANTVRLAEIARGEGVPTFHIETERELQADAILGFKVIGVTAGASTPHWVFQAVVEKIQNIARTRSALVRALLSPLRIGVHTYIYLGAGSAAMTYTALRFLEIEPRASFLLLSFLYVVSMHILNRFMDRAAAEINDPFRMTLFGKLAPLLLVISVASAAGATVLSGFFGLVPAVLMGASLLAGTAYNVRIFHGRIGETLGFRKLKEIPGSKDLFPAAAWAFVTVVLPCLATKSGAPLQVACTFLFAFLLVLNRFLIYDLKDIEGDRLVGNETLPLTLGRRGTGRLLSVSLGTLGVLTVLNALAGPGTLSSIPLAGVLLYTGLCGLLHYRRTPIARGIRFELLVDAQFLLLGILARLAG